jgi:serine/threonine-protein kinase
LVDRRKLYRFVGKRPLGEGGFAKVWKAVRKADQEIVAFKEPLAGEVAAQRLRREIEVQSQLAHPHIMPILEADPDRAWFTMPLAEGSLRTLRAGLNEEDLASIIYDVADALAFAHESRFVHRDITPSNILGLPYAPAKTGRRWLIADWGLVRRPDSQVSRQLTRSGQALGTLGFAAPETWYDGHTATAAADVYSLGRVAAWFLTDQEPRPNVDLLPDGPLQHWRAFVRACTALDISRRPADMSVVKSRLADVFAQPPLAPANRMKDLVENLIMDNGEDFREIVSLALDHQANGELYVDQLARVPPQYLEDWTRQSPADAAGLAQRMSRHLLSMDWGDRDPDYANTPLNFVHTVLRTLVEERLLGLAEDVAEDFFLAEVHWNRWRQKTRTETWLARLDDVAGQALARALRAAAGAVDYHRQLGSWRPASTTLRATLVAASET